MSSRSSSREMERVTCGPNDCEQRYFHGRKNVKRPLAGAHHPRPPLLNSRVRVTMTRKDQKVEALGVVRIVKPRIGMGVEFIDVDAPYDQVLARWVEQLRRAR